MYKDVLFTKGLYRTDWYVGVKGSSHMDKQRRRRLSAIQLPGDFGRENVFLGKGLDFQ